MNNTSYVGRLPRIEPETASAAQRVVIDELLLARGKPGGRLANLFAMMVHKPPMAQLMGAVGAYVRFHSSLPELCREAAILTLCQSLSFDYETAAHREIIAARGLPTVQITALLDARYDVLPQDLACAARFANAASALREMPTPLWEDALATFSVEGTLDLLLTCAHYTALSVVANTLLPVQDPPGHSLGKPT